MSMKLFQKGWIEEGEAGLNVGSWTEQNSGSRLSEEASPLRAVIFKPPCHHYREALQLFQKLDLSILFLPSVAFVKCLSKHREK